MKQLIIILVFCILFIDSKAQSEFYYYGDSKVSINTIENTICISLVNSDNLDIRLAELSQFGETEIMEYENNRVIIKVTATSIQDYRSMIEAVSNSPYTKVWSSLFHDSQSYLYSMSTGEIIVKLKNDFCYENLEDFISTNDLEVKRVLNPDKKIYLLKCNNICGDIVFPIVYKLYNEDMTEYAEPNFYMFNVLCTSDPMYSVQWALHQDGPGISTSQHINIEPVWNTGNLGDSNIKIGLVDNGVYAAHPDLADCLVPGYNIMDDNTNTAPHPYSTGQINSHGTICAGIIGASHNDTAIAGIAPMCKIMPVKVTGPSSSAPVTWLADGITYAANNEADIICCSYACMYSNYVKEAINTALKYGRNGLGCVIVAPSGNKNYDDNSYVNDHVLFPANMEGVVSVGALHTCNHMADGISYETCSHPHFFYPDQTSSYAEIGHYGDSLDIVAPGVNVLSTADINCSGTFYADHSTVFASGTSVSCAHAAGVAALILSQRPDLHNYQVNTVLKKSASKVNSSTYTYTTSPQHPYSSWNNETGYGELNANSAVFMAGNLPHNHIFIKDYSTDYGFEPTSMNRDVYNSPDITLTIPGTTTVVTNPQYGDTYNVNVTIRNIGTQSITIPASNVQILWAITAGDPVWNSTWQQGGTLCNLPKTGQLTPAFTNLYLGAGQSITFWTQLSIPNYTAQPCNVLYNMKLTILVVVNDGNTSAGLNMTNLPIYDFVRYNNNVARKYYTIENSNVGPIFPPLPPLNTSGESSDKSYYRILDNMTETMNITPNPVKKDANVSVNIGSNYSNVQIQLLDATGRIVFCKKVSGSTFHFSTADIPAGCLYMVLIGDGEILEKKQLIIL